ncbi:neural Wiskott-Aldrich syndrome protein-like [Hordeum vulgare subsp. vulgare]|uniref:neural Wiskott-Aldrich syndrome protein-like n=1 Tax=Hordeum vulgare subsp. vulgare TaxID=112509 RepID=UPI001D1A354D|nr:neural Wiskott-Aldrich syndrome protein-like [Hordeum vulgare subsp. vulgare]
MAPPPPPSKEITGDRAEPPPPSKEIARDRAEPCGNASSALSLILPMPSLAPAPPPPSKGVIVEKAEPCVAAPSPILSPAPPPPPLLLPGMHRPHLPLTSPSPPSGRFTGSFRPRFLPVPVRGHRDPPPGYRAAAPSWSELHCLPRRA